MLIKGQKITLEFAKIKDKKLIYNMLTSKEIVDFMFDENESESFFCGIPSREGSYLLIKINEEVIGSISYANEYKKEVHSEIDIWIRTTKYTRQGIGTEAINLLIDFLHKQDNIKTFLIRPWIKNVNAIKAYKKCGFKEIKNFNPEDFYTSYDLDKYGDGDYGIEETVNLIKRID